MNRSTSPCTGLFLTRRGYASPFEISFSRRSSFSGRLNTLVCRRSSGAARRASRPRARQGRTRAVAIVMSEWVLVRAVSNDRIGRKTGSSSEQDGDQREDLGSLSRWATPANWPALIRSGSIQLVLIISGGWAGVRMRGKQLEKERGLAYQLSRIHLRIPFLPSECDGGDGRRW